MLLESFFFNSAPLKDGFIYSGKRPRNTNNTPGFYLKQSWFKLIRFLAYDLSVFIWRKETRKKKETLTFSMAFRVTQNRTLWGARNICILSEPHHCFGALFFFVVLTVFIYFINAKQHRSHGPKCRWPCSTLSATDLTLGSELPQDICRTHVGCSKCRADRLFIIFQLISPIRVAHSRSYVFRYAAWGLQWGCKSRYGGDTDHVSPFVFGATKEFGALAHT